MGVFLGPLNKVLGLISDILWKYRPSFYGRFCPIYFSRELGFDGFVFMLYVSYIDRLVLKEYVS